MLDPIYLVEPVTKQLTAVTQVSLADLGVKERKDLEEWVISHPDVLGEPLLIVTTEYDQFDKSDRRLDVLALDKKGTLVVVELKLDLSRSVADQQAIRYAAFCSTMTVEQLMEAMASFHQISTEDAGVRVREFLDSEDLPELNGQPRIILAAGALDDEELTSTVLWLRTFGLDISCIEIKPYRLPNCGQLILVPRTIIPLPEAAAYQVRVEHKQAASNQKSKQLQSLQGLWNLIANKFVPPQGVQLGSLKGGNFLKANIGHSEIHYEWCPLKSAQVLRVALHFESSDRNLNLKRLQAIALQNDLITASLPFPLICKEFGKLWTTAEFHLPWNVATPAEGLADEAVRVMQLLIDRTLPIVEAMAMNSE